MKLVDGVWFEQFCQRLVPSDGEKDGDCGEGIGEGGERLGDGLAGKHAQSQNFLK